MTTMTRFKSPRWMTKMGGSGALTLGIVVIVLAVSSFSNVVEHNEGEKQYIVTRVIDGDTIVINKDGESTRVRLYGIDAPEMPRIKEGERGECGAEDAKIFLELLLHNSMGGPRMVWLDIHDVDKYGRLVGKITYQLNDNIYDVSNQMIEAGYAEIYHFDHTPIQNILWREAVESGVGLWGECEDPFYK